MSRSFKSAAWTCELHSASPGDSVGAENSLNCFVSELSAFVQVAIAAKVRREGKEAKEEKGKREDERSETKGKKLKEKER